VIDSGVVVAHPGLHAAVAAVLLLAGGCGSEPPRDLGEAADLSPPSGDQVRVLASGLEHPILKPLAFDDRDGLSPDEAAVLAVVAHPVLRAARARRGIAAAQVIQAGILPNPEVLYAVGFPVGERSQEANTPHGGVLTWEVTSLLARSARIGAAEAQAAAVDLEVAWQEWQVSQAARMHAVRLLFLREEHRTAQAVADGLLDSVKVARQALELGQDSGLDLAVAESARSQAAAARLKVAEEEAAERLLLQRALGFPAENAVQLEETPLPAASDPPPAADLLESIEARRLDLLALRRGYESQEERVRAAVRGGFPRVRLGVLAEQDPQGVRTVGFGIAVALPIFDRGQGEIAKEEATREALFEEYRWRLFEARHQVAQILSQMDLLKQRLAVESEALEAERRLLVALAAAFEQGNIAAPAYYDARRNAGLREIEVLRLRRTLADLEIGLGIATGRDLRVPAPVTIGQTPRS
jgi:outer membrane protein TolC